MTAASVACSIRAARSFRRTIKNCVFEDLDKMGAEMEQARQDFIHGSVQQGGQPRSPKRTVGSRKAGGTVPVLIAESEGKKLQDYLNGDVHSAIRQLRTAMRRDLGVDDQDS